MPKRSIGGNAVGKHIGHACEGHLRAALKLFSDQHDLSLSRSFEISGQVVRPDAVISDANGVIVAVIICAYWDHSGSSEKKYYRTRIEYTITHNLRNTHPEKFSDDFKIVTFFYGSETGWKNVILNDLVKNCRPFVFLPSTNTTIPWQEMVDNAYAVYKRYFEAGSSRARQATEDYFSQNPDETVSEVLSIVSELLGNNRNSIVRTGALASAPALPEVGYTTRLRQPLCLLSLVDESSVRDWHANGGPVDEHIEFSRKMFFRYGACECQAKS